MDTQEKEKKSEEIAAQTAETQEQPAPAQPSEAALKEEKKKVEAELNKGFPGNRSVGKLFWGYLVCGSLFWALMFYGVGRPGAFSLCGHSLPVGICIFCLKFHGGHEAQRPTAP